MWLLRTLTPGYRTIADFRKNNTAGLQLRSKTAICTSSRFSLRMLALLASP